MLKLLTSDNVDYANKKLTASSADTTPKVTAKSSAVSWNDTISTKGTIYNVCFKDGNVVNSSGSGDFSCSYAFARPVDEGSKDYHIDYGTINFKYEQDLGFNITPKITVNNPAHNHKISLSIPNVNNNETRPKTKFFSLLIYAGYPIA